MRNWRPLFKRALKLDADPVLLDPNDPAAPDDPVSLRHQVEAIRDIRGVGNIQGRTVLAHIANPTTRARSRRRNVGHFVNRGPLRLSALFYQGHRSAEGHANARSLSPNDAA